jgi:hypothetical protein
MLEKPTSLLRVFSKRTYLVQYNSHSTNIHVLIDNTDFFSLVASIHQPIDCSHRVLRCIEKGWSNVRQFVDTFIDEKWATYTEFTCALPKVLVGFQTARKNPNGVYRQDPDENKCLVRT